MVNLTKALWMPRSPKTLYNDGYWRKRQILKLSAHFYGRARNCFSIAIRRVQRSLQYVVAGRKLRKQMFGRMWDDRIASAAREFGNFPMEDSSVMLESLARSQILLNRQMLSNLAVFEPRTFKAINNIAADKAHQEKMHPSLGPLPTDIKGKLP